jgi:4-coumarate--CoA ligase
MVRVSFSGYRLLMTSGVFRRNKDGNYYCVDRIKELIKCRGFQLASAVLTGEHTHQL